ncbi:hypothetical protein ACJROX_07040 [Pseudalkalibacillus sp. A8]|uniref:hypothetical protein n=1 Tax=Pseudalkalibacillus sp. A8 TaxID=3382641 RepID=UPI0038B6AC0B
MPKDDPKTSYPSEQAKTPSGEYKNTDNRIPTKVEKRIIDAAEGDHIATKRPQ